MHPTTRLRSQLITALAAAGLLPSCASTVATSEAGVTPDAAVNSTDVRAPTDVPVAMDLVAPPDVPVVVDASVMMDAVTPDAPVCPGNVTPSPRCMTPAESVQNVRFPPGKWVIPDGGRELPDGGVLPSGCALPSLVSNDCCNPAAALREENGQCCYTFCNGGCCGRPLRVHGEARIAPRSTRADWFAPMDDAPPCDPHTRAALATAWLDDALLEHASVAAFARFSLELMALGAPPELLASAMRAGLDEVDHARRCFSLAARFGAGDVGPGPLDLGGVQLSRTMEEVLDSVIDEGCVGETLSALLASTQRAHATDVPVREALERIADDESRHAALSWRFVGWALRERPELRERARARFDAALRAPLPRPSREPAEVDAHAWNAHGRLTARQVDAALSAGVREVLRPCVAALLGEAQAGAAPDLLAPT